jgi:hypothetical protein
LIVPRKTETWHLKKLSILSKRVMTAARAMTAALSPLLLDATPDSLDA